MARTTICIVVVAACFSAKFDAALCVGIIVVIIDSDVGLDWSGRFSQPSTQMAKRGEIKMLEVTRIGRFDDLKTTLTITQQYSNLVYPFTLSNGVGEFIHL